jgi:transcriptional regulator with XRE-family HTH domain
VVQARTAKKLTQKELATAINEKPQVVAEYESGKAMPNPQIILKLERSLGVKLPRSGKPKVTVPKPSGPTSSAPGAAKKPGVPSAGKINALTRGGPPKRR